MDAKASCAFTGHRPKSFPWRYNEADARCVALKETLAEQITRLAENGIMEYLSGMAEAVDTWAALTVLALREKNPRFGSTVFCPASRRQTSGTPKRGSYIAPYWSSQIPSYGSTGNIPKIVCWNATGLLVSHAALLLAVYNGVQRSGTAATVNYARKLGREIIVIDPITRLISHEEPAPSPTHP